jgi:hypothetical protein
MRWGWVLILAVLWLFFESTISWFAFCQPYDQQSSGYQSYNEYCAFRGPAVGILSWAGSWLIAALHDKDKEIVAAFTIILGLSTILLWISTRDAARGGERAANVAERALTELERAFVFVKEIDMFTERGDAVSIPGGRGIIGGEVRTYRIAPVLENSGQTPAVRLVYNINCGPIPSTDIEGFTFPDQGGTARRAVIGPKATLQSPSEAIPAANMDAIASKKERWFIWGWIDYDDIFRDTKRHRTEFCLEVSCRRLPNGQPFIGFPMHDRFNATDSDCQRQPEPYMAA